MKAKSLTTLAFAGLMAAGMATAAWAQPPKMKYTTEIPPNVITPDRMETRLGTLKFVDGVPHRGNGAEGLGPPGLLACRGGHDHDHARRPRCRDSARASASGAPTTRP